jgi:hypothetical protein
MGMTGCVFNCQLSIVNFLLTIRAIAIFCIINWGVVQSAVLQTLDLGIGVRVPTPQFIKFPKLCLILLKRFSLEDRLFSLRIDKSRSYAPEYECNNNGLQPLLLWVGEHGFLAGIVVPLHATALQFYSYFKYTSLFVICFSLPERS